MGLRHRCAWVLAVWACAVRADERTVGPGVARPPPAQPTAALGLYRPAGSSVARYFVVGAPGGQPVFLAADGGGAESAFGRVREASPSVSFTTAAGVVTLRPGQASIGGAGIFDAAKELSELLASEDPSCSLDWRIQHNPLSLTGDLLTYEKVESGQMACGPPGSSGRVQAVNLRTLKQADIREFVRESSLVEALRRDSWIRRRGESEAEAAFAKYLQELDAAQTSQELVAVLSRRLGFDASELLSHFCVLGYDATTGNASVRLVATSSAGFDRTKYLQLGVVVLPLPAFQEALAKVSDSTGFFAGRFANGVVKKAANPRRAKK